MFKNAFDRCPLKVVDITTGSDTRTHVASVLCPKIVDLNKPDLSVAIITSAQKEGRQQAVKQLSAEVAQLCCQFCVYKQEGAETVVEVANIRAQASAERVAALRIEQQALREEMQVISGLNATRLEHSQMFPPAAGSTPEVL